MKQSIFSIIILFLTSIHSLFANPSLSEKPNIIVILVDDMGYSDIGCYGSEIKTPNLDRLAANGARFSQFYNTSRCCPTRASLLTGLYSHQAGVGLMTGRTDRPGYKGRLMPDRCVTIAQVLKSTGYSTYMTGKWHLGNRPGEQPLDWGFDRFYGSLDGAFSYFHPGDSSAYPGDKKDTRHITLDRKRVELDRNFYATDRFSDYAISFLKEHHQKKEENPFFLYLSYNAPHWPLQALPEDIAKYEDTYRVGWDEIRSQRYQRQIDLGLINPETVKLTKRFEGIPAKTYWREYGGGQVPAWKDLSDAQQRDLAKRMAVYAAMVDRVDQGIGRLLETLRETKSLDNTIIFFLADNGGALGGTPTGFNWFKCKDLVKYGTDQSFISYGTGWANASNTPFRNVKCFVHEGGIATPLIVHWPRGLKVEKGSFVRTPGHLVDIMTTCVDLADARYPKKQGEHTLIPMEGTSLLPLLQDRPDDYQPHEALFWEHTGNKAVRYKDWKLVSIGEGKWELYDMDKDRSETKNVASEHPEIVGKLSGMYKDWAKRAMVSPFPL
jgi:arylsulfatase A-like enzyme